MPRRLRRQPVRFWHEESGLERIDRNFEPSFRPLLGIPRCIDLRLVGNRSRCECYVFLDCEPIVSPRLGLHTWLRCLKRGKSVRMTVPVLPQLAA